MILLFNVAGCNAPNMTDLAAKITLQVMGTNGLSFDPDKNWLILTVGDVMAPSTKESWKWAGCPLYCTSAKHHITLAPPMTFWVLEFKTPGFFPASVSLKPRLAGAVKKWNKASLDTSFLPTNTEVGMGFIEVIANSTISREFMIFPQRTTNSIIALPL